MPQTPLSPDLTAHMERIRETFLERLGDRVLEIDMILQRMDREGPRPELRDAIVQRAHKTAGVAPSLGYDRLGELARAAEEGWTTGYPRIGDTGAAERTAALLDEMERLLDAALEAR
jgi:HPt (histidine-containing phosphotransfer) domain-containing protein